MAEPRRVVDPARRAAYDVLRAVRADDAYTNLALPAALRRYGLTGRDAAFATELAAGTIRWQGTYDAVLAECLDRPLRRVQGKVLDVLRLGAHQLLGMRVPAHAALSATVDLARDRTGPRAAGLVNAVLRRVAADDLAAWVARVAPDRARDPLGWAAVAYSHPRWVVEALAEAIGVAELEDLLAADNEPARVVLAARPGLSAREELPGEPTRWSPYGVVLVGGDPGAVPAVAQGRAGVQDEGSQLVAMLMGVVSTGSTTGDGSTTGEGSTTGDGSTTEDGSTTGGEVWLDLCAGPGGKAALLAGLAGEHGARLVAAERLPHRAGLVARALTGADAALGVLAADGTRPAWGAGTFDRVLVDAPCTGLGALRRRPEARWRRTPADLETLVALQRHLLGAALDSVRPGGVVVYATCSPVLAETRDVVASILADRPDVTLADAGALLPDVPECAGPLPGTVQLWPHRHGTDAMFLAVLRR